MRASDGVVHVRARVVSEERVRREDETELVGVEVNAVCEQRAVVERAGMCESGHDASSVARHRVALVDGVFGRVDVEPDLERPRDVRALFERLVGKGEGRVRADEGAGERAASRAACGQRTGGSRPGPRSLARTRRGRTSRSRGSIGYRARRAPVRSRPASRRSRSARRGGRRGSWFPREAPPSPRRARRL